MKKFAIIIGISSLLLLTSCIKMDINQTINKDGVSKINAIVDMSAFLKMSESMSKMNSKDASGSVNATAKTGSGTDPCGDTKANPYIISPTCTNVSTGVVTIAGDVKVVENKWLTIRDGVYIYDLRKVEKIIGGDKEDKTGTNTSSDSSNNMSPAALGFNYTYNITMPGEIVYSDVGTISGSTLTMDYFDVIKLKTAYVVSKDVGVVLTADDAKILVADMSTNTPKKEIKILTLEQQQQVRDMIAKVDKSRLQIIVDRINLKIEQIQAKKTKFISDTKNITILEDVKTLIQEALYN